MPGIGTAVHSRGGTRGTFELFYFFRKNNSL
jgi:hypothetical protein